MTLFDTFDGLDEVDSVDFYRHEANWSNRMILGDSLQVMASLAERETLRGRVQMVYIDPPYGIKFGSNWQVSARKRDVKDGKLDDVAREAEQIKAFRDTWELGIHSYLTYLRDRLLVGSLMSEVFGIENHVETLAFRPDIEVRRAGEQRVVELRGVDVFDPTTGEVRSRGTDRVALWMIDTDYNEESFFVRHCYFTGGNDPYKRLKVALKAEIDADAWATLNSTVSRPFDVPASGRIAVKVINDYGDEVMKVYEVQ